VFSIIIPLYNKAPYIAKAIQSVASQTFQEFELIVIDDGSKDCPLPPEGGNLKQRLSFIENCEDFVKKVRIIKQENQGVSNTRNNGVKLAKYDYIAFLDADDWWEPTFLEEMKVLIDTFPEAGIYGSGYYKVRNGAFIPAKIGVPASFNIGYIDYFKVYASTMWMPLWTGAVVIPKTIYEEFNGFKPELKMGEDFHLWVRIAAKYKVAFVNKQLSNYNQDVDIANRAVDEKLYMPHEHMLFADYGDLMQVADFRSLYEVLAVYGLMPYYLAKKNKPEVEKIISTIHWENHSFKYRLYYRILPRIVVVWWYKMLKLGSISKNTFKLLIRKNEFHKLYE
jgi:glycosyltransferase involved in cell wall biosynthesis